MSPPRLPHLIAFFLERCPSAASLAGLSALLYAADTQHFIQTGRTISGLTYIAHAAGPVPADPLPPAAQNFSDQDLTRRQMAILNTIAVQYAQRAPMAADAPGWIQAWADGQGAGTPILLYEHLAPILLDPLVHDDRERSNIASRPIVQNIGRAW